jgi:hypothetical protein
MKTLKNYNLQSSIAVFLFSLAFAFLMSGCEKQEALNLGNQPATATDQARQSKTIDAVDDAIHSNPVMTDANNVPIFSKDNFPFDVVKIQHFATRFDKAEWSVTVTSEGIVTFEGKRNCAVHGNVSFNIKPQTLAQIGILYNLSRFNSIVNVPKADVEFPVYTTSSFESRLGWGKILRDFDDGYPAALVYFRTKVVELLDISKYIGTESRETALISGQAS